MKNAGILLLIVGLAFTLFTGFNFITKKKVVDIGELEISANQNHFVSWSPILGIAMMAAGAGLYLYGRKS
ncbi:MAG: hypothetical protein U5K79_13005 [Cyclobacteriaceae bacterium]|nr:hypothetical protein [Cyclobacteriaceae bacterium]